MPTLEVRDLAYRYDNARGLDPMSFTADSGEIVALVGPSGSGKSTLMALLALTLAKQSGHVSLAGQDWDGISRRGRDGYRAAAISTILQDPLLMPHLTVEENVLSRLGYVNRAHLDRAHKLLSAVGLAELAKSSVTELSGGERSRVSMARGLMSSPKLIVADEPTSGLDRANKDRVLRSLRDAVTEALNEVTPVIIIATHDQDVMSFADRAIALEK